MARRKINDISDLLGVPKGNYTGYQVKKTGVLTKYGEETRLVIVDSKGKSDGYYVKTIDQHTSAKAIFDPNDLFFAKFGGVGGCAILRKDGKLSGYALGGITGTEFTYDSTRVGQDPMRRKKHGNEK